MIAGAGSSSFSCKKETVFITLHQPWTAEETQLYNGPGKNPTAARFFRCNHTQYTVLSSHAIYERINHTDKTHDHTGGIDYNEKGSQHNPKTGSKPYQEI